MGLALSDPLRVIASPFRTLTGLREGELFAELQQICTEQEVELVVVGLPLGMKNQETAQTENVREFAERLAEEGWAVELEDERLSSVSATRSLIQQNIKSGHNKDLIDRTAAAIILQQYLDRTGQ